MGRRRLRADFFVVCLVLVVCGSGAIRGQKRGDTVNLVVLRAARGDSQSKNSGDPVGTYRDVYDGSAHDSSHPLSSALMIMKDDAYEE